ncbi:MAG: class I poly(R)-hydroxyalkanoic acid synthase, partial [Sulfitobacter geojensis]
MTTKTTDTPADAQVSAARMAENLKKVEALAERLGQVMSNRQGHQAALDGPNQELFAKAGQAYAT